MITDEPFRYVGPDILYPDEGRIVDGRLEISNYLPSVLKHGLSEIGILANKLEPNPPFTVRLMESDSPIFQRVTEDGLATRLGLPYVDVKPIHAAAIELARSLYHEDLSKGEKDERTAMLGYVAIAETQTLAMANKRVGRAIYGRLRYGYGPENIKRGVDAILDDRVPDEIERLVLLQNITRYRNGIEPMPSEFGGIYVNPATADELDAHYQLINPYRHADNTSKTMGDFSFNCYQLSQQLNKILGDGKLAHKVSSVLIQKDYGPAAWLLCCNGVTLENITPDIANELIATNTRLLQMRLFSLLNSVANGGRFVEIIDSDADGKERDVRIISWKPTEMEVA